MTNPVFIIASERSGTNLVRKRLTDAQTTLLGPSPAHFLKHLYFQQPYYGDLYDDEVFAVFLGQAIKLCTVHFAPWRIDWSAEQLVRDFPVERPRNAVQVMDYMMTRYAQQEGFDSYICKDNHLYEFALDIATEIPDARFIYLYRDPRDFVLSQLKRQNSIQSPQRFARLWQYEQTRSIKVAEKLESNGLCISVSYEDFIKNEAREIERLLSFLGLSENSARSISSPTELPVEAVQEWQNLEKATMTQNSGKYRDGLSKKSILDIEAICRPQMQYLGYVPENPSGHRVTRSSEILDTVRGYVKKIMRRWFSRSQEGKQVVDRRSMIKSKVVNYRNDS